MARSRIVSQIGGAFFENPRVFLKRTPAPKQLRINMHILLMIGSLGEYLKEKEGIRYSHAPVGRKEWDRQKLHCAEGGGGVEPDVTAECAFSII